MATLTTGERAALIVQLAEANAAYHAVMIGGQVREFHDQNGEKIVYSSNNRFGLIGYINQLRAALGMCPMPGIVAPPAGVYL